MRRTTTFLLFLILLAVPLAAQETEEAAAAEPEGPRAVTIDDLVGLKNVGDAQISPDGQWVLYTLSSPDLKKNSSDTDIWRVSTEGAEPLRMTTSDKSDRSPRWSPCGAKFAFISSRGDKPQIYIMNNLGGEAEKLTDHSEGVGSFAWRPTGGAIAFTSREPLDAQEEQDRKDKKDQIIVDEDLRPTHLWLFDLETKEIEQITEGEFSVTGFEWTPDGEEIVFSAAERAKAYESFSRTDIFSVKPGDEPVLLYENLGPDSQPTVSPDGARLAFLSRPHDLNPVGTSFVMLMDRASGEVQNLTEGFAGTISGVQWCPAGNALILGTLERTETGYYYLDLSGERPRGGRLTEPGFVYGGVTVSGDGTRAAFLRQDPATPQDIYTASLEGGSMADVRRLTDTNPQVENWKLGRTEVIQWPSRDGMMIEGLLVYPVDYQEGTRYPMVVKAHGGPAGVFTIGFQSSVHRCAHYFAGKGWAMLMPNVRGSVGRGDAFEQANINDWGGGDYQDLMTGVDYVIEMGVADPDKLAMQGWSYGGYLSAWVITQTDRFAAAAPGAGLTNLVSMYGTNDIPQVLEEYFGGDIYGDQLELYRERSPLTHAANVVTPTLIQQGQQDNRVPLGQAQEFYYALKKKGVPVQLVLYPREGHGPRELNHQRDVLWRQSWWFHKHVLDVEIEPLDPPAEEESETGDQPADEEAGEET